MVYINYKQQSCNNLDVQMFYLGLLQVDECDIILLGEMGHSLDNSIETISQSKHFYFQLKFLT